MSRTSWRGLVRAGLLAVFILCVVSASVEHVLERRDTARLTANSDFYSVGGRRVRYELMVPPGPTQPQGSKGPDDRLPTVVLLSGLVASLEQWDRVQTSLSAFTPVLSYDRAGTGFSDPADAYDASAQADELDQLLHAPKISGPFVLVSFSSSSMLAIVFAARHPDVVKGLVFVDPTMRLSTPGAKTYRRMFWRPSIENPLKAFFGFMRLEQAITGRHVASYSPVAQRTNAILESTHHWLSAAQDSMSLDESADEAEAVLATGAFSDLPLGVFTTMDPRDGEFERDVLERHKRLAASSHRGLLRAAHGDHSELLNGAASVAAIVDLIRTVAEETRVK